VALRSSRSSLFPYTTLFRSSIARTGYTGEDGVEVFFRASDAAKFWTFVLERGAKFGAKPCGLGARDTLRLEMCYPLNGSELSAEDRKSTRLNSSHSQISYAV